MSTQLSTDAVSDLQKVWVLLMVLLVPSHLHSTPLPEKLHWLPISEHIKLYKVACSCMHFSAIV